MQSSSNEVSNDVVGRAFSGLYRRGAASFEGDESKSLVLWYSPEELSYVLRLSCGPDGNEREVAMNYLNDLAAPDVSNADNRFLGAVRGKGFLLGAVDEINGAAAAEITEFVVTRHELLGVLARWLEVAASLDYEAFLAGRINGDDMRRRSFAWRRIARITKLVGDDAVDEVGTEVFERIATEANPRYWAAFVNGSSEERSAVQALFRESREDLGLDSRHV